jgi:hypothetical protein
MVPREGDPDMTIHAHVESFAGLPVREHDPEAGLDDPAGSAYRLSVEYDDEEEFMEVLARFLEETAVGEVRGLVIGAWQWDDPGASSGPIVEALVAARESLPNLRALFLGDIIAEENEISWIVQSDVTPLFDAFPELEHFRVRGGTSLAIGTLRHEHLKSLIVETGGLDGGVVRGIGSSDLPRLEHLELWLGTDNYGGNVTLDDLRPILLDRFPVLARLGLRDAEIADEVARAVAEAPVATRLEVLDLSLGNLGDEGALALAASPAVAGLKTLDIHHHYVSDEALARLKGLGIEVIADDRQEPYEDDGTMLRFIAVTE